MAIDHAPWATGVPPVCTAYWDQDSWDKFAESFRPEGYEGDIRDHHAYTTWAAEQAVAKAKLYEAKQLTYIPAHTMSDIDQHCGVARMCGCGTCFCCCVRQVMREQEER